MADSTTHRRAGGLGERSVFWMILISAVAVVVLIAIVIAFAESGSEGADHGSAEEYAGEEAEAGLAADGDAGDADVTPAGEDADENMGLDGTAEVVEGDDAAPEVIEEGAEDIVADPDDGGAGTEPDGGAEPFFPTPSGPGGSDGNALTTD